MADKENRHAMDELVRRKVNEEFDISFREEDWRAMQRSLDARAVHQLRVKRWRRVAVASLLMATVLGLAALQNHLRVSELTRQLADGSDPVQPHEPLLPVPELQEPGDGITGEPDHLAEIVHQPDSTDEADHRLAETGWISAFDALAAHLDDGREFPTHATLAAVEFPAVGSPMERSEARVPAVRPVSSVERERTRWVASAESGTDGRSRMEMEPGPIHGFSLGLVLAPDLSMAGSMPGFDSPGIKAGVTVDLGLGSGLWLQTGVIYSGVRYSGDGSLYNPSGTSYGSITGPESMHAVCHLLDIPVSLRVRLHEGEHSRIIAGAGISSYIMLNERYRFSYAQSAPGQLQEWEGATGTRHWASHASLSVGYEMSVGRGWRVRAEPYLRLPVRDVGWANVKLYSIGTLFSLSVDL